MEEKKEEFLDATQLPPAIKHKTIFETFDNLEEGESFILHNDHDPKPLYYQLSATQGDIFTWDYLKRGPDVFEIRIGKKILTTGNEEESENGEKVLDGICLDPAVKFQTIMKTFNDLKEGEGFILKNDHDPKPLYYHLSGEHGDTFTWDYLQEGPEVFKIRIAKKVLSNSRVQTSNKEEHILDGIALDPAVKFQTIMKTFNDLKEGENFILHNDHDPKPLYYQLSATHGDTFTWEYLKQGPDAFDIRIGKKILTNHEAGKQDFTSVPDEFHDHILFDNDAPETARTIVAKDYRKAKVFRKFGLDCAWKGNRTLSEICKGTNITEDQLRKELALAENDFSEVIPSMDYYHWDMAFLADYVLQTHHRYVRDNAKRISEIAEEVAKKHGKDYTGLAELGSSVRPMIDDFIVHMSKEENVLFPAIKHMLGLLRNGKRQAGPGGDIARGIAKMEAEHDETQAYLKRFREITNNYQLPEGACEAHEQLYRDLQLFENDSWLHVHLENNILFPKTIILEKKISGL